MSNRFGFATYPLVAAALVLVACGGGESGGAGGGGSTSGGAVDTLRTLDTCTTKIADGVPEFYSRYFRCVDISMSGGDVVIKSTDLPPHKSAYYPSSSPNWTEFDPMGGTRGKNPFQLSQQSLSMTIPSNPTAKGLTIDKGLVDGMGGTSSEEYHPKSTPGIALDGVAIFHGVAAPGAALAMESKGFDSYDGHPEMTGTYHYHGESPGPLEVLAAIGVTTTTKPGSAQVEVYGIMCDGTLVLGCTEIDGSVPDSSDFDAQNGHAHDIVADGATYFTARYHTHVCQAKYTSHLYAPEIQYHSKCGG